MTDYIIINKNRRTNKAVESAIWPEYDWFRGFATAGEVVELVEKRQEIKVYCGVRFIVEGIFTHGEERLTTEGFTSAQIRAKEWIERTRKGKGPYLPTPKCDKCKDETLDGSDIMSIAETGKCWKCRLPKKEKSKK